MGHANAAGSRFCSECGVSLEPEPPLRCSAGHENAPGTRFCTDCGLPLADRGRSSAGEREKAGAAWWLHFVPMPVLAIYSLGLYPIAQFTRWQRSGGKPLFRRIAIAFGMTLLYCTVIGWIVVVPWWRRNYAAHRASSAERRRTASAAAAVNPPSRSRTPPPPEVGPQRPPANASHADNAQSRRSSAWAEWWRATNRDLGHLGLAVTLSSLSIPGIIRSWADQHSVFTITNAISTTLPLTAAAAIITYCAYRKITLSGVAIVYIFVLTALATALLGVGGGGPVREVFLHVRRAPSNCFEFQGTHCFSGATQPEPAASLPQLVIRLVKLYWNLWGVSGILSAVAVGWFLGRFWARRVIGALGLRPGAASGE